MKILTKQNEIINKDFQKHAIIKWCVSITLSMIIVFLCGVLLVGMNFDYIGIILMELAIYAIIIFPIAFIVGNKILNKYNKSFKDELVIEYEFSQEHFTSKTYKNDELIEYVKREYTRILNIEENKNYFYVYVASNIAYCVDKKDMDEEDENKLRGMLQSRFPKYKIYKWW